VSILKEMPRPELSPYFIHTSATPIEGSWSPARASVEDLPFREYLRLLRRHLSLVIAVALSITLVSGIILLVITPIYTATSTILIEPQPPQVLSVKQVLVEPDDTEAHDYYKTQYALLRSRSLAQRVIKALGLQHNEIFAPSEKHSGFISDRWLSLSLGYQPWAIRIARLAANTLGRTKYQPA
jgi:uncharacterized protein involved in exopolysaccharide biosynthesis